MRLAGCLTVPSKPTKKTRQGLAAKALQQAQEQLRHGQGRSQPRRPPLDPSAVARHAKRTEKEPKIGLGGCLTVPSKPTKKTCQGLAAKALQQAQEQLRHGQGAASQARSARPKRSGTACKKGPKKSRTLLARASQPEPCSKHKSS